MYYCNILVMKKFPKQIPIFPLGGVIYFPKTNLPLNIFEQRYLNLVNDVMKKDKLMGMVQLKKNGDEVYNVGCLGKISDFQKDADGRIIINLTGLTRFTILKEVNNNKLYREFEVAYNVFDEDVTPDKEELVNPKNLEFFMIKTKKFFEKNGLLLNWKEFEKLDRTQQINTLSMIAPVTNEEKQKLLETVSAEDKRQLLLNIIEFYLHDNSIIKTTIQ